MYFYLSCLCLILVAFFSFFQGIVLIICVIVFTGSVIILGVIVSVNPLDELEYKGLANEPKSFSSPYASSVYLGWAMASAIALIVTGVLPIISWFSTYRFSLSSAVCVGIFTGNLSIIWSLSCSYTLDFNVCV